MTRDYEAGDIFIFSTSTLHATLDNVLEQTRLSLDARFQLDSEPVNPRFDSSSPSLHKPQSDNPLKVFLRSLQR